MHRRRWFPGRGTWGLRLVFAAVGVCVIVVVGVMVRGWWKARQVEAELARIRAAGEPVTFDELAEMYRAYPADEEATQLWLDAFAAQQPFDKQMGWELPMIGTGRDVPVPGTAWEQLEDVEKYLEYQSEFLDRVRKAAAHGSRVRLPLRFDLTWQVQLLEYADPLRSATRLLALEAYARAHRGDEQGAADSLRVSFACGRVLRGVPDSGCMLIRGALDEIALSALNELVTVVDFSDRDLAAFQEALRNAQYKESLYSTMLSERVGGISILKNLRSVEFFPSFGPPELWLRGDFESYLHEMRGFVERTKRPWPEALRGLSFDDVRVPEPNRRGLSVEVSSDSLASHQNAFILVAGRFAAGSRCADAALAVWRYRRRHGELPGTLGQLVPELLAEVPSDPFDGAPLRYVVSDDGFAVYSVGEDGTDDGGDDVNRRDIVFRVRLNGGGEN